MIKFIMCNYPKAEPPIINLFLGFTFLFEFKNFLSRLAGGGAVTLIMATIYSAWVPRCCLTQC